MGPTNSDSDLIERLKGIRKRIQDRGYNKKKYDVISEDLHRRIRAGEFAESIPGQRALAGHYHVNFLTIRKAIATLVDSGVLSRYPSRGIFVTRLQRKRTQTLAAVFGGLTFGFDGHYAGLLQGIQDEAARHAQEVLLAPHHGKHRLERQALQQIIDRQKVDGVLLWPTRDGTKGPSAIELLREARLPFVVMMRLDTPYRDNVPYVVDDDYRGGYAATEHLIAQGHKKIGYLSRTRSPGQEQFFDEERWRGCRQAQLDAGFDPGPRLFADWPSTTPDHVPLKLIEALKSVTAVFCMNDRLAISLVNLQKALGFSIPKDLSVVGYDDIEAAEILGLTTVRQPLREIGSEAVRLLMSEIAGTGPRNPSRCIEAHLVVRSTTTRPAG